MRRNTLPPYQGGLGLLELMITLAVLTVVLTGIYSGVLEYGHYAKGKRIATSMAPYHQAAVDYTQRFRVPLTGQGGPAAGTVTGVVDAFGPTISELRALNLLGATYLGSVAEVAGTPTVQLTLIPTGCVGTACDIGISVVYPAAITSPKNTHYRALDYAVGEFGAAGGYSLPDSPATITGANWAVPNPRGAVAGVFGTYRTYSASGLAQFLTVSDTRDANFLSAQTMHGTLSVDQTITSVQSVGAGTGTGGAGGCSLAELASQGGAGRIFARASDCVARVFVDGGSGTIETRTSTGDRSVRVGSDGALTSFSSTGIAKAGITYTGVISTIYADNLRNTDGTAGVRADGSVYGTTAGFTGTTTVGGLALSVNQVAGGACTAGNFARDVNGRWLECVGNLWRLTGLGSAAIGAACSEGPFAINSGNANDSLICRGGVYVSLNTAIGLVSIIDSIAVVNGSVVAAPTCAAGTTAGLMTDLTRIQTPAGGGATRISYSGSGPWTISITGAGGEEAEVWRVCRYSGF